MAVVAAAQHSRRRGAVASSAIIVTEFRQPREQAKAMGVFAFVASAGGA